MPWQRWFVRLLLAATMLCCVAGSAGAQASLNTMLAPLLARYQLPASAVAVVKDGKVVAVGAVGTRQAGVQIPVTVRDRFHLGSDTKAMTALLAGMFVEADKLRGASTSAEVIPELAEMMDQGRRRVTLDQFLLHTSGIPSDNDVFVALIEKSLVQNGNLDDLGYWLVQQWSTQPLASEPGTTFASANMNYVIVGAMIERIAGKTWDDLIIERVFTPLGLRSGMIPYREQCTGRACDPGKEAAVSEPQQDHAHRYTEPPSELTLRVKALESLLIDKGLVDPAALDALIDTYETKVGPRNGAQVVARAWRDPAFKRWLFEDATAAIASMGYTGRQGEHMKVVENTPTVQNLVVCTLCSCYPWPVLGLPPVWYKSAPYRARAVADPRGVLQEFGTEVAESVDIRVWDSTSEMRYLVLPERPEGTEGWSEEALAALVTRNAMIGLERAKSPQEMGRSR